MSSLGEFQNLTMPQVRLFMQLMVDEAERARIERKLNEDLRRRNKGGGSGQVIVEE